MSRYGGRYSDESYYASDDERVRRVSVTDDYRPAGRATPTWLHQDARRVNNSQMVVHRPEENHYTLHAPRRAVSQNPPAYYDREQDFETDHVRIVHRDEFDQRTHPRMSGALSERNRQYEQERLHVPGGFRDDESISIYSSDDYFYSDTESETEVKIRHRSSSRPARPPAAEPAPPPAPPAVVVEPTIEREVITHYTNVDHGTIDARPRPPPMPVQAPARSRSRHRHAVEIDIEHDDRITNSTKEDDTFLRVSHSHTRRDASVGGGHRHRHAQSMGTLDLDIERSVEAEGGRLASRIDARGRMGEAYNGVTRDWSIIDVPPGTQRVRVDGVGCGAADITWQRYNGVRRTHFIPERDEMVAPMPRAPSPQYQQIIRAGRDSRESMTVEINKRRTQSSEPEMWTEITRDLVSRSALRSRGYKFEETQYFFYVPEYLNRADIAAIIKLTKEIRREKRRIHKMEGKVRHGSRHRGRDRGDEVYDRERSVSVHRRRRRVYV